MSVLAVGSIAFDTIQAPGGRVEEELGGSATYFSLAASLFSPVAIVAVVGDDFPDEVVQMLMDRKVDCVGLERRAGKTFRWCGRYGEDVNVAITERTDLGVFGEFKPVIPDSYRDYPFVALGNIDPVLQLSVLDQVSGPKLVAADTMNYWIDRQRDDLGDVIGKVDVLIVNDAEAKMLGSDDGLLRAMTRLLGLGPKYVLAKKGEHGAVLMSRDFEFILPAFPLREVADPTGAGDSFAGGFMGYLAETGDVSPANLCRAVAYGATVASFTVEGLGTRRLAAATREEVDERLARLGDMTRF
ncbi:MAG: PfkB family carbohydrate kinase [Candidatus Zixiibacteriota bacterium]|jgi:sugar/nucleoside kinase (ribokinase family)